MVSALFKEIDLTTDYLSDHHLSSIYFGGGTPSLLSKEELSNILDRLSQYYTWDDQTEITLEANPEDLTLTYCRELLEVGINRLSIGIQSFEEHDLVFMNRAHSAAQSTSALENVNQAGFTNYSIDLMFGLIGSDLDSWRSNILKALDFSPKHISCYNLTIEEQTAFDKWQREAIIVTPIEEVQHDQFTLADELLTNAGYDHYEISNYAQPGSLALHNTNYWKGVEYLGIGPAAHSYNGDARRSNIANNALYIKSVMNEELNFTIENLSPADQYNEVIMLGLRTKWGVPHELIQNFPEEIKNHHFQAINQLEHKGLLEINSVGVMMSTKKWYSSDDISSQLFIV